MGCFRVSAVVGLLVAIPVIGCGDSQPPSQPTPPAGSGQPSSYAVSGTVFEVADGSSRPLIDSGVSVFVRETQGLPPGLTLRGTVQNLRTDRNGRYTTQAPRSSQVFVAVWNRRQPCIVSAAVDRDTSLDVHVFALGTVQTLPAMPGPTVTGFVFEMTPEGRKPLRNAEVWLDLSAESYIANTETDEHGRFLLCGVNTRVRLDVSVSGYEPYMYAESVPGTGNRHFEFEFKR